MLKQMSMTKPTLRVAVLVFLAVLMVVGSVGCAQARRSVSGIVPYHEQRLSLSEKSGETVALELSAGDSLEGSVQELFGDYKGLVFSVTDPNGKSIYDVALKGKHDFTFRATIDGYYALTFFTVTSSKEIILKYRRT